MELFVFASLPHFPGGWLWIESRSFKVITTMRWQKSYTTARKLWRLEFREGLSQTRIRAELVHIHPYSSWAPSVFPPSRNTESQNIEAQLLRRIVGWNKKKEAIDPGAPSPPLLFFVCLSICLCARVCVFLLFHYLFWLLIFSFFFFYLFVVFVWIPSFFHLGGKIRQPPFFSSLVHFSFLALVCPCLFDVVQSSFLCCPGRRLFYIAILYIFISKATQQQQQKRDIRFSHDESIIFLIHLFLFFFCFLLLPVPCVPTHLSLSLSLALVLFHVLPNIQIIRHDLFIITTSIFYLSFIYIYLYYIFIVNWYDILSIDVYVWQQLGRQKSIPKRYIYFI